MTVEEAIRYLTEYIYCEFECDPGYTGCIDCIKDFTADEIQKVLWLAKEALEKQIPRKGKKCALSNTHTSFEYFESCPVCGCGINPVMHFCEQCGQALDWSEEE